MTKVQKINLTLYDKSMTKVQRIYLIVLYSTMSKTLSMSLTFHNNGLDKKDYIKELDSQTYLWMIKVYRDK